MKPAGALFHGFAVVAVSAYLLLAACWLLARGKLDRTPVRRLLQGAFRRKWRGPLRSVVQERGKCFVAALGRDLANDADVGSTLVVLEDGVPLPHPHTAHDDVRALGAGRYSHWGTQVYFAASDDSDPRTNGRAYTAAES